MSSITEQEVALRVEREITEMIPNELPEGRDPSRDEFIDEVSAEVLAKEAENAVGEEAGAYDYVGAWDSLSAEERETLLNSGALGRYQNIGPRSPRHISKDKAPKHLHLRWMSLAGRIGHYGYRPVLRKPETMEWVPNMPRHGKAKVFVDRGAMLCAIPMKEWLKRVRAEHAATNVTAFQRNTQPYQDAMSKLAKSLGLSPEQAARLDREGITGFTMTRKPDPHGGRDMVRGGEEGEGPDRPQRRMGRANPPRG